jgi:hypothetical protein
MPLDLFEILSILIFYFNFKLDGFRCSYLVPHENFGYELE